MSDSSRVQLRYLEETTWGQIPAIALNDLRFTGESLKHATDTTKSSEIRSDRQVTDVIRTSIEAQGGVDFELSYAAFDDLIAGAMMADWGADLAIGPVGIDASATGDEFTDPLTGGLFASVVVGQWVKTAGFADPANNGFHRVTSKPDNDTVGVASTLVTETGSGDETMKGSLIKNGITKKSFTLEKEFADVTEFVSFSGMRASSFSLSVSPENIITGSFAFLGKNGVPAGATVGTGGPVAAPTNDVMNAIDNVQNIEEGGAATTLDISEISLEMNNATRGRPAVGVLGNTEVGIGTIGVTGSFNAYFADRTLYEKYTDFTASSLSFRLSDAAGNAYVVTLPSIKFTDGDVVAGGQDQDVIATLSYEARRDAATDAMIQFDRFAA